jgi:hypothetical protein
LDRAHRQAPPPRNRRDGWPDQDPVSVRTFSDALPARAWRRIAWRNGTNPPWEADFAAIRVTPTTDWRHPRRSRATSTPPLEGDERYGRAQYQRQAPTGTGDLTEVFFQILGGETQALPVEEHVATSEQDAGDGLAITTTEEQ